MFRTIVCGIDTSPQSLDAARQALALGAEDATCWGVSVWDPALAFHAGIHMAEVKKVLREEGQRALRTLSEELPQVQPLLVQGKEVAGLLGAISNLEADLVCVGASGTSRPAGIVFGSLATAMVHHAPCSVLVARNSQDFPGVIVHANDGSAESRDAGRAAAHIASLHGNTLVTLHIEEGHGEGVSEEAVEMKEIIGVEPVLKVERGSPHRRIVEVAQEIGASLIVMGSRGRTGLAALGSVSERVTHRADCSVLVVRQSSHPVFGDDTTALG
ncbi:MAG TPA: universal stress protein [Thermoanaerobaculia bacterium]|nr:universal stress protein [Thermoanaerobaculia bacterium]